MTETRSTKAADRKHLRLTVPISFAGIGAIYYGISMLSLANGNMTTALAVAANVDFLPAIAAMSLRAVPAVALPVVIFIFYRLRDIQTEAEDQTVIVVLTLVAWLTALFFSSVITVGACLLMLVMHLIYVLSHKKNWKKKFNRGRFDFELAGVMMLSLITTTVIWGPSWLTRETTTIAGKEHLVSVVKETDELIYYLDRKSNRLVYAKPADLTNRAFCGGGDFDTMNSLVNLLMYGPTYPNCPNPSKL